MRLFDCRNMEQIHLSTRNILEQGQKGSENVHDYSKIHQSIEVLKSLIPQAFNDDVINQIYSRVSSFSEYNDKLNYSLFQCEGITFQDELIEDSHRAQQQERMVAKNFCSYGYGYAFMRYQISNQIDPSKYEDIMFRIIITALQHLESFLVDEGKVSVKSDRRGLEKIYGVITHDSKKLAPEISDILKNVIKGLHQIMPYEPVTKQQAHILHKALKRTTKVQIQQPQMPYVSSKQRFKQILGESAQQPAPKKKRQLKRKEKKEKISVKEKEEKYQLHKRWIPAYQQLLLALYRKTANIAHIRDRFQVVFSQDSPIFTVQALRSKLFKILRAAIKKLQQISKQNQNGRMTPLVRLDDSRVKTIINNCEFRKVRLVILDAYSKDFDIRLLNETVTRINMLVSEIEDQPRSVRASSRGDDRNSQMAVDIPFYHPFNSMPAKVKETRLKYNREYTPRAQASPSAIQTKSQQ